MNYIKNDIITVKLTSFLKANNTFAENVPEAGIKKEVKPKAVKTAAKMTPAAEKKTGAPKKTTQKKDNKE